MLKENLEYVKSNNANLGDKGENTKQFPFGPIMF
jgi:hypothetical protein